MPKHIKVISLALALSIALSSCTLFKPKPEITTSNIVEQEFTSKKQKDGTITWWLNGEYLATADTLSIADDIPGIHAKLKDGNNQLESRVLDGNGKTLKNLDTYTINPSGEQLIGNGADKVSLLIPNDLIETPETTRDSDKDGLTDEDELNVYHTNPYSDHTSSNSESDLLLAALKENLITKDENGEYLYEPELSILTQRPGNGEPTKETPIRLRVTGPECIQANIQQFRPNELTITSNSTGAFSIPYKLYIPKTGSTDHPVIQQQIGPEQWEEIGPTPSKVNTTELEFEISTPGNYNISGIYKQMGKAEPVTGEGMGAAAGVPELTYHIQTNEPTGKDLYPSIETIRKINKLLKFAGFSVSNPDKLITSSEVTAILAELNISNIRDRLAEGMAFFEQYINGDELKKFKAALRLFNLSIPEIDSILASLDGDGKIEPMPDTDETNWLQQVLTQVSSEHPTSTFNITIEPNKTQSLAEVSKGSSTSAGQALQQLLIYRPVTAPLT